MVLSPNGDLVWLNVAGGGEICCWGPWAAQCTLLRVASRQVLCFLDSFLFVNARFFSRLWVVWFPLGCFLVSLSLVAFARLVSLVVCG